MFDVAKKRRSLSIVALCVAIVAGGGAPKAKIARTTLAELVQQSDLVLYGETTHHVAVPPESNYATIWFKVMSFPKRLRGLDFGEVPVCDEVMLRDTIDLRKFPGSYVVFARANRRGCFSPVAGYKSLIPVRDGIAQTINIDDEPDTQPLSTFLNKVQGLAGKADTQTN
jgi:hypothetical protein